MAGGKDQKDANQMLREQQTRSNAGTDAFAAQNTQDTAESKARAADLYGSLSGGYKALAGVGREQPVTNVPAVGGGGGGGGGGAAAPGQTGSNATFNEAAGGFRKFADEGAGVSGASNKQLDDTDASYRQFMQSGGWDPNRVTSMDENISGLKQFGKTGGLSADDMNRMQGGGVYDEFARTGGLSEGARSNIRSRATSTIPQFYANMKDEASRQAATQGGYGPGQAALMARFGRGQAAAGADASLNAELGITDKVNAGRLAGAGGMATSAQAAQGLRTGNMLKGISGAGAMEQGLQESIRSGKEYGTTGLGTLGENQRQADMRAAEDNASYRLAGTQGLGGMAEADRQAAFEQQRLGQSGAGLGLQAQALAQQQANWAAQFQREGQETGLGGLASLYGGAGSGEYNTNKQFDLTNRGQGVSQGQAGASALKTGNKSWADYAAPIAGAVAGGLTGGASFLGGMAARGAAGAPIPGMRSYAPQ
jgi:hypothetical protein